MRNKQAVVDQRQDRSDNLGVLWFLLGLFFPIVGLVLQIVWWQDRRRNAKAAMWGWIIPVGFMGVIMLGSLIFGAVASSGII